MNLHSSYPYWLLRHGIINSYPSLYVDLKAEIVIMGAGISGALVANQLCQAGYNVVIVDRRHAGMGSTATSLLQYEIDKPLHQLIDLVGKKEAVNSYQLCRQAIFDIKKDRGQLKVPDLFALKPSFQFASLKRDVAGLYKEYTLRKQASFG